MICTYRDRYRYAISCAVYWYSMVQQYARFCSSFPLLLHDTSAKWLGFQLNIWFYLSKKMRGKKNCLNPPATGVNWNHDSQ